MVFFEKNDRVGGISGTAQRVTRQARYLLGLFVRYPLELPRLESFDFLALLFYQPKQALELGKLF